MNFEELDRKSLNRGCQTSTQHSTVLQKQAKPSQAESKQNQTDDDVFAFITFIYIGNVRFSTLKHTGMSNTTMTIVNIFGYYLMAMATVIAAATVAADI